MIRVLLADDHQIVLDGLSALLDTISSVEVISRVSNGADALAKSLELNPDIAILDISMPAMNGIEVILRLQTENPQVKVIVLSMHADRHYVLESLRAGARGYILKDSAFQDLRKAIQRVMQGGIYLSPRITDLVVEEAVVKGRINGATPFSMLSDREREILQFIAEGHKTRDIAGLLFISAKTVETHRKRIMDKLGLHSVAELTKYAVRHGITGID